MCRYGMYKSHLACFKCRKMFRRYSGNLVCPECGGQMRSLGLDFKAPKQKEVEQWVKVELLAQNGITFHSCGCSGPCYRPGRLREVPVFLERYRNLRKNPGELLLDRWPKNKIRVTARTPGSRKH